MTTGLASRAIPCVAALLAVTAPAAAQARQADPAALSPAASQGAGGSSSSGSTQSAERRGVFAVSGMAFGYRAEHRMRYLGAVHEQSGNWLGGEGTIRLGPITLRASGLTGKLSGDTSVTNPDRTVRVSSGSLGVRPAGWLEFGADVGARRVETSASTVVTRLVGGHVGLAVPLGLDGLAGTASATYYPVTDVTGDEKLSLALAGEMGFLYTPPRGGVMIGLAYRFERYDYSAGALGPARLEQQRSVVARVGLKLGS